jgi:hypothetical protein
MSLLLPPQEIAKKIRDGTLARWSGLVEKQSKSTRGIIPNKTSTKSRSTF